MRNIIYVAVVLLVLTSCSSIETVTLVNRTLYTNFDAYVAYDLYTEFYNNGVYEYKPIMISKNKEQP